MTVLVNAAPFTILAGASEVGPLSIPQGTSDLLCTYDNALWPDVSDATITVSLLVSDNNGATYRTVWGPTAFEHVSLFRGGVKQTSATFGAGLGVPFGATSKLRIAFTNSGLPIATVVTITAV